MDWTGSDACFCLCAVSLLFVPSTALHFLCFFSLALSCSSFRFAINSEPLHRPTSILCSLVTERDPGISECFCVGVLTLRYGTSSYFCQGTSSTCSGATPASLLVKPPALYSRQLPNCTRIASSSSTLPTACTSFPPCRASFCPVPLPEPLSTQPLANIPSSPPINEQTSDLDTPHHRNLSRTRRLWR